MNQCHQEQADQKRKIPKIYVTVSDLTRKRKKSLRNIAKKTILQKARLSGRGFICYWAEKNNANRHLPQHDLRYPNKTKMSLRNLLYIGKAFLSRLFERNFYGYE